MSKLTDDFRRKLDAVQAAYYGSQDEPREAADDEMWGFWGEVEGLLKTLADAISTNHITEEIFIDSVRCVHCSMASDDWGDEPIPHKPDCPVMVAKQLLGRLEE